MMTWQNRSSCMPCSYSSVISDNHQKNQTQNLQYKSEISPSRLFSFLCILNLWFTIWKNILNICLIFFLSFPPRLVHQQDNFQQEALQPILSYSLIDTLPKRTLMWSHNISAPLALLSCFTDISFKHKRSL